MAENLVINGVTYPSVETIEAVNTDGETVSFVNGTGEHGYKEWIVTFPSRITSGEVVLATDEEIAKHYTDTHAMAMMKYIGDESNIAYHDTILLPAYNESIGSYSSYSEVYGMGIYMSSSQRAITIQNVPLSHRKTIATILYVNSNGELCFYGSTTRALCNGDYKIQFWW